MSTDSSKPKLSGNVQADLKKLGKYKILRRIGAGGMGTVYLAQDTLLNRTVALKVLPRERAENPILVRRFQSEARASAMLTHDNIVSVFDADQADGYLYIALEFIDGIDLFEWLRKRETIPLKRSIDIIRQVASALEHAHEKRLVHRDIKPANIMITKEGLVKLADMGLARSIDETLDTTITRDGTTVGTVDYMSPEQAGNSKNTDIRSDLYSLGCTWYHMLTGSPPYPEGSLTNKLAAHAKSPIPDPRDINPNVSEGVVAIIHRLMEKKKEDRYQTPTELLDDLNNCTNLDSNPGNLLAALLEDEDLTLDEQFDEDDFASETEASADFIIQSDSQTHLKDRPTGEPQPDTTSSLPSRRKKRKQTRKAESLPTPTQSSSAEHQTQQEHPQRPADDPNSPVRRPLKRAQSPEDLHSDIPERIPQRSKQTPEEISTPSSQQQKTHPEKKARKDRDSQKKRSETLPKANKKKRASSPAASSDTESDEQSLLSEATAKSSSGGIDVDWMRVGMVLLIASTFIGAGWWTLTRSGTIPSTGDDTNPYGNVSPPNPANDSTASPTEPTDAQVELNETSPSPQETNSPSVLTEDTDFSTPKWTIADWSRPQGPPSDPLLIQRGNARNTFRTIEDALKSGRLQDTIIDASGLQSQSLVSMPVNLPGYLKIQATKSSPILSFRSSSSTKTQSWLQVTGGILELEGLHFLLSAADDHPCQLLDLKGTQLILRNCTFTTLGESPTTVATFSKLTQNNNHILIENCLFRGPNLTCVKATETTYELFCRDSVFATQQAPLFDLSTSSGQEKSSTHLANCTLISGDACLQMQDNIPDTANTQTDITLNRNLMIGANPETATALRFISKVEQPDASKAPRHLLMKQRHTRFLNFDSLTRLEGTAASAKVTSVNEWNTYWKQPLPSDDLTSLPANVDLSQSFSTLSMRELGKGLEPVARPGVGERALIGAPTANLPTLDDAAVERAESLNLIARNNATPSPFVWSEKSVRFDLNRGKQLQGFLNSDQCPNGTTVTCFGAGLRTISPVILKNRKLRLQFEQTEGTQLTLELEENSRNRPMFEIDGGTVSIEQGIFQFPKARVAPEKALFLHCKNGANVELERTQVSQALNQTGTLPLIACEETSDGQTSRIEVNNSLIAGYGPLIREHSSNHLLQFDNSIFVAATDVIALSSSETPGTLTVDSCTFSQGNALIRCLQGERPVQVSIANSIFANPPAGSSNACLIHGDDGDVIKQTINWWESSCATSHQIQTAVRLRDTAYPGSFIPAWTSFWGPHHIYDPLHSPQAIVMKRDIQSPMQPVPEDFELQPTCPAATWTKAGNPLGASPSAIIADQKKTAPNKKPGIQNTPTGF